MLIEILVFPGVDELDALAPFEVLRNAAAIGANIRVRIVSLDAESDVTGAHGLRFATEGALGATGAPELLFVPGGGWNSRAPQGAWAEAQRGAIPRAIGRLHAEGSVLAAVCTGAMLIAASGILRERHAVTHHRAIEDLRSAGVQVIDARVVDDGDIITSGGVTSGLDLALYVLQRFVSAEIAQRVGESLEYERRGGVWRQTAIVAPGMARS
jgi:transcriptional regulator GlxA family with amidase domain